LTAQTVFFLRQQRVQFFISAVELIWRPIFSNLGVKNKQKKNEKYCRNNPRDSIAW